MGNHADAWFGDMVDQTEHPQDDALPRHIRVSVFNTYIASTRVCQHSAYLAWSHAIFIATFLEDQAVGELVLARTRYPCVLWILSTVRRLVIASHLDVVSAPSTTSFWKHATRNLSS